MIEVRSQYLPHLQRLNVYMFDRERGEAFIYIPDGPTKIVSLAPDTELPVFLSLPESTVAVIHKALEGELWKIPQPATQHHLEDAIAVRDRMMNWVEGLLNQEAIKPS